MFQLSCINHRKLIPEHLENSNITCEVNEYKSIILFISHWSIQTHLLLGQHKYRIKNQFEQLWYSIWNWNWWNALWDADIFVSQQDLFINNNSPLSQIFDKFQKRWSPNTDLTFLLTPVLLSVWLVDPINNLRKHICST